MLAVTALPHVRREIETAVPGGSGSGVRRSATSPLAGQNDAHMLLSLVPRRLQALASLRR
jgi:hypothetical protein